MSAFLRWPLLNSLQMIQWGKDAFWANSIPSGEVGRPFYQKCQIGDLFYFQFQCMNGSLKNTWPNPDMTIDLVDNYGNSKQSYTFNKVATSYGYAEYTNYEISGNYPIVTEGYYFLKITVKTPTSSLITMLSEPIMLKAIHPNTLWIDYANANYNYFDIIFSGSYFSGGGLMGIRIEGGQRSDGFVPGGIYKMYQDLDGQPVQERGIPLNVYKFKIGSSIGIPNYLINKINRIFSLEEFYITDNINFNKTQFRLNEGSKPARAGDPWFPMAGWEYELLLVDNEYSKELDVAALTWDSSKYTFDSDRITFDKTQI